MIIFKIAFRNIFRQKRRSLLTGLTIAVGFILLSFSISLSDGSYNTVIDVFTKSYTGHVQIHKKGYLEKPSLYKTFNNPESMGKKIEGVANVKSWTPRVFSSALSFIEKKTTVANIIGIDPLREPKTTFIRERIREGSFISETPTKEVMLGSVLAEILKAEIDDEIVLITQGADGSIANDIFKVSAIMGGGNSSFDRVNCYMHIDTVQDFLTLNGRYHELTIVLDDYSKSRSAAGKISSALNDETLDVEPWQVVRKQFNRAMEADKEGMYYTLLIIVAIVAIGVLNTVLMAILERTREFGVLKALGTRPFNIFSLIVLESTFLALISIAVGVIISVGLNYFMSVYGIEYPVPFDIGGITMTHMYGIINARSLVYPAATAFLSALFVSIIPAIRASKMTPVKAMRI